MAKLIILEGLSRTGKTTISNKLESEGFGRIISLVDKRPIDTDIQSFYKGVASISNEFYKAFPEETFILDRSFLSELVYCEFFEREPSAEDDYVKDLLENNEVILFYLYNDYSDYQKRSPKDRHIFTEDEYEKLRKLFINKKLNLSIETFSIDTSTQNLEQVYNIIKNTI
jgi:thymidylate kinase